MKKRILCNLLVLVLLLGLLPTAALAGGGSEVVWSDDFQNSDTWESWTVIDANWDEYGFSRYMGFNDSCDVLYFASSPETFGESSGMATKSDDYLISPVIDLESAYHEFELSYDCRCVRPDEAETQKYTKFEVFVIAADTPLTEESMRELPVKRFTSEVPHEEQGWITHRYDLTAYAGRRIRLVFHHNDNSTNKLHLDNFQILDCETDSHIQRVAVLGVPEPEVGLGVPDVSEDSIVVVDAMNLELVPGSLTYLKTVSESGIPQTGDFEDGAEYSIRFQLKPRDGAFTYSDTIASVNGRNASILLNDNGTPEDESDDFYTIFYYYGYLHGPKQAIENASVSVTPPVLGKMPDYHVKPDQDSFELTSVYWCEVNSDSSDGQDLMPTDHFESGKEYRCYFLLTPHEGYIFPNVARIRVNGGDPIISDMYNPDGSHWFCADFTTLENDDCTVSFFAGYCESPGSYSGSIGDEFPLPTLADQKDHVFAGWAYHPWDGAEDVINPYFRITKSCMLYAVWLEVLHAPEVYISTPGVYRSVKDAKVVVEKYTSADYSCAEILPGEEIAFWKDSAKVGKLNQRDQTTFWPGQTYYGMAYLEADENHCFDEAAAGLKLYGATLDEAVAEGRRLRFTFHLSMPVWGNVDKAALFVDTMVAGWPVDETYEKPIYSLTPGLDVKVRPGIYQDIDDAYTGTNVYVGGTHPGETYYAAAELTSTVESTIDPGLELTVIGGRQVGYSMTSEYKYLAMIAFEDQDAYSLEVNVVSTDGGTPCGYIRGDLRPYWTTGMDGPYVRAGEHWFYAAPMPGYVFQEWKIKDGETLSTDALYSFDLNDHMDIQAVFGRAHAVSFLNAHGDNPATQYIADGKCAAEPTGLTATDFVFTGWYTDPTCTAESKYDFSKPVTGDLVLYSGWTYSPGMSTDKTDLNNCIAEVEAMDTSAYTDESVAALQQALEAAKEVQADPTVSQDTVDGALDNLSNAVFGLVLKAGYVDFTALDEAIADAEALDTSCYTTETVTALAMTLTGAKMVREAVGATQADVDTAVENIKSAVAGLEVRPGAVDKNALNKAIAEAEAIDTSKYTEESATALGMVLTGAKMVQSASDATQADVDAAVENIKTAVADLELRPDAVDRTWLGLLIEDAETELAHKDQYTEASVTNLQNALESAKSVYYGAMTQEAVDAAAAKLDQALNALQYNTPFRFDDVKDESKFYFAPVYWAYFADPQITNGMTPTTFGPDLTCTRGQIVTFLWRAKGCPEPSTTESPFTDVTGGFYYKAVLWAVEKNITNGMTPTTFGPDAGCTRAQVVTFLWRAEGSPEPGTTTNPFTDVTGGYYYKAVLWANEKNITNGMTPTTFGPEMTCTRGQIVTFLKRAIAP